MTLAEADCNTTYTIGNIETNDPEMENFLFTLGVYEGENITLVSTTKKSITVVARDGRYTIDRDLANSIRVTA